MNVEKIDGTIQPFRFEKIKRVVDRVFESKPVCAPVPEKLIDELKNYFENFDKITRVDGLQVRSYFSGFKYDKLNHWGKRRFLSSKQW